MMKEGEEALLAAVDYIGGHDVQKPEDQLPGKATVDSEGYHTTGSDEGAASWIHELNSRFIDFNQTANLAWNLITSYYEGTAFWPHGLMHAFMPWANWYTVPATIWATAHYTQFTSIATPWYYAKVSSGSGYLAHGGSYVSLLCPSSGDWTLVIEKMPGPGTVGENATFTLGGGFFPPNASHSTAAVWSTLLSVGTQTAGPSKQFQRLYDADISTGTFTVPIQVGQIITVTTLVGAGSKGEYPPSSPPAAFPPTYSDDFNSCLPHQEAKFVTDFNGVFECEDSGDPAHGMVMRQMVPAAPIRWWADTRPHSVIGDVSWEDTTFSIDFRCTNNTVSGLEGSAMVGVRASLQGRDGPDGIHAEDELPGLWFAVSCGDSATPAPWQVTSSVKDVASKPVATGTLPFPLPTGTWHTLRITANGTQGSAWVDGTLAFSQNTTTISGLPLSGWAGFGTINFGDMTQFDNLAVASSSARCSAANGVGGAVALWPCNAASPAQHFTFVPLQGEGGWGSLALTSLPTLCMAVSPEMNQYGSNVVVLDACNTTQGEQLWALGEEGTVITKGVKGAEVCLDVAANVYSPGSQLDVFGCQSSGNQRWTFEGGLLSNGDPQGFFCAGSCK